MNQEPTIGTVFYSQNRFQGMGKHVVIRETPTQLVFDKDVKIKKGAKYDFVYPIGSSGWDRTAYSIETPELIAKYNHERMAKRVSYYFRNTDISNLPKETLEKFYSIIQELTQ